MIFKPCEFKPIEDAQTIEPEDACSPLAEMQDRWCQSHLAI